MNLDFIRAEIRETNISSQHMAESCGFVKQFIDRNHFVIEDKFLENAVIYDLTPETMKCYKKTNVPRFSWDFFMPYKSLVY